MALADEVQSRVRTQFLVELTNPNDRAATTVNTTILGFAVTDTIADLALYAGVTFDLADARHVTEAVNGVVYHLIANAGRTPKPFREMEGWREKIHTRLRLVTGNNRVRPKSSSNRLPADEPLNSRPAFDMNETFTDLVPDSRGETVNDLGIPPR